MTDPMAREKAELRRIMHAVRAECFAAADRAARCAKANAALGQVLADQFGARLPEVALAGYMAMRSELDPTLSMAAHPGPVCVPVVKGRGQPLEFHRWTPQTAMTEGAFKAQIPAVADPLVPRVLIVPLLAFDRHGYRLGYGGGFYDRTLEELRAEGPCLAIGFAFAGQEVEAVPRDATDQPLDLLVTTEDVIRLRG